MNSNFKASTARIWDDFYGPRAEDEVRFYLNLFRDGSGPNGKTLDIGCGTGRFMVPMLEQGFEVTGIDASEAMLAVLEEKAGKSGLTADIRHLAFDSFDDHDAFEGIVAFYVIFYFLESRTLTSFFKRAFELLAPGGQLLFSYYNVYEMWRPKRWSSVHANSFEKGFGRIEYTYTPVDYLKGIADMADYRMVSKDGAHCFDYVLRRVRFYTMTELGLMLKSVGFRDVRHYADLNGDALMEDDTRGYTLYAAARKPELEANL